MWSSGCSEETACQRAGRSDAAGVIGCESGAAAFVARAGSFAFPRHPPPLREVLLAQAPVTALPAGGGGVSLKIVPGPHRGLPCGVCRDRDRKGRVRVSLDTSLLAAFPHRCKMQGERVGADGLWSRQDLATCKTAVAVVSFAEEELGSLGSGAPCQAW